MVFDFWGWGYRLNVCVSFWGFNIGRVFSLFYLKSCFFVFRRDNQPCEIMEQTQCDTISCVSINKIRLNLSVCSLTVLSFSPSIPFHLSFGSVCLCSSRIRALAAVIRTPTPARTTGTFCRHANRSLARTPTSNCSLTANGKVGTDLSGLSRYAFCSPTKWVWNQMKSTLRRRKTCWSEKTSFQRGP